MSDRGHFNRLTALSQLLVSEGLSDGELFKACEDLYRLFIEVSGLDASDDAARSHLQLSAGKAIGASWAAQCILDFKRTRAFLKGVLNAIFEASRRFPDGPIRVLYAGCGPFATLVVPLVPLLSHINLSVTLVEVSPLSLHFLKKTLDGLGIKAPVTAVIEADATRFRCTEAPHVIIAEMLQAGLQKEPQVAAFANLFPQLASGGIFIPEEIQVHAGLLNPTASMNRMLGIETSEEEFILLDPFFRLSPQAGDVPGQLPGSGEIKVPLPADRKPAFSRLALFTGIRVFGEVTLQTWDCGLTLPVKLTDLPTDRSAGQIFLKYEMGDNPGIRWRLTA